MNLPNAMSFARLIVGLALLISYLFLNISISHIGFLFIIAALSDGLDGYIARRYNCCTAYGAWLDHLSDKVLVSSALIILSWVYPTIYIRTAVWIMIQREYLALAARSFPINDREPTQGEAFQVHWLGKLKTATQCVAIGGLMLSPQSSYPLLWMLSYSLLGVAALLSVLSCGNYFIKLINQ